MRHGIAIVLAAALLGGCQINPAPENRFTSPIFTIGFEDTPAARDRNRPPYVMSYPDETMFFYPIYDRPLRSDLVLRQISCHQSGDGALVVSARVQNLGADIIPIREQIYGEVSAFRVLARVTWTGGVREDVYGSVSFPMSVSSAFNLDLSRTRYFPKDVTQIEVLVDPDQVVPDPVRSNNVLVWRGTMNADVPSCDVKRT